MIAKKQEVVDIGKIFSLHGRSFSQKYPQSEQGHLFLKLCKHLPRQNTKDNLALSASFTPGTKN